MNKADTPTSPGLRFSGFDSKWQLTSLHKLLHESKLRNTIGEYTKNDVLSVSGTHGIVNQIELQGRSFAGISLANYHVVGRHDVVYTKSPLKANPYGIIKYNPGDSGIVSTLYAVYTPKQPTVSAFLDYYFQLNDNVNRYLRPLVHKGAKNDMKINNSHVLDGHIYTPTEPEQKKIIDYLRTIDSKITLLTTKVQLLKKYKQNTIQGIFSQQINFKDSRGDSYPAWSRVSFGRLVEKITDSYNPKTAPEPYRSVELESLSQGTGKLLNTFPAHTQRSIKIRFSVGDVLYGKLRPYLRKFYFANFEGVSSSEIWVLRAKAVTGKFLYYLIQTQEFNSVVDIQAGSKMPRASWGNVSKKAFLVPTKPEQLKITTYLTLLDSKISMIEAELFSVKKLKKALLQKLFM